MVTNNRLFYLWCVLSVAIVLISILPGSSRIYHILAAYDSDRWVHFLAYGAVATIPFAAWKRKASILLSLSPAIISIVLGSWQAHNSGHMIRTRNVPADLFGIAAGILLGLNIRVMRNSEKPVETLSSDSSRSVLYWPKS